jgi:hypothetical protein
LAAGLPREALVTASRQLRGQLAAGEALARKKKKAKRHGKKRRRALEKQISRLTDFLGMDEAEQRAEAERSKDEWNTFFPLLNLFDAQQTRRK